MRHPVNKIENGIVFRMWRDGMNYEVLPNEQAPDVYGDVNSLDVHIDSILSWFTVTDGMTGQYGYNGPVMHDSEFISRGMIEDILAQYDYRTHYFVWQPVNYNTGDTFDIEYEGWVILAREVPSAYN